MKRQYLITIASCLTSLTLILLTATTSAAIYRSVGPDGTVSYSNQPTKNSTKISLDPASVSFNPSPSPKQKKTTAKKNTENSNSQSDATVIGYKTIKFITPHDQQTFQNQRQIPVTLALTPSLRNDDKIQLYLNNKPLGSPANNTSFSLQNLVRGSYTLQAKVLDKNNRPLLSTPTITIYIHLAHVGGITFLSPTTSRERLIQESQNHLIIRLPRAN